jgi:DNA-directed RNA polymerase subunit beta
MPTTVGNTYRIRKNYGKIRKIIDIPNLIDVQKKSYDAFLQGNVPPEERLPIGLQGVFLSVFPIEDFNRTSTLEFVSYRLETPKYDVDECRHRGMTYAAPLQVKIRLVIWDLIEGLLQCTSCGERIEKGREKGVCPKCGGKLDTARDIHDAKEQEVYFGEIPLMTEQGTFIVNGTERVIVSQLHRSPGVFFDHDKGKTHSSGKLLYSARIIPYRGSWIDFEFDHKDILYVRIDRRRKMPASVLLKALGKTTEELLNIYYQTEEIHFRDGGKLEKTFNPVLLEGQRASKDIKDSKGEVIIKKGRKITKSIIKAMQDAKLKFVPIDEEELLAGKYLAHDVVNPATGEVLAEANAEINQDILDKFKEADIKKFNILFIDNLHVSPSFRNTLLEDKTRHLKKP